VDEIREIGELRQYTDNWEEVKIFYDNTTSQDDTHILTIPIEIHQNSQRSSVDIAEGYSFSPSDADVLSAIQDHYRSRDLAQHLRVAEQKLYLVYSIWRPEK